MNKYIMRQAGFDKKVMMVEHGICPTCCKSIGLCGGFRNDRSQREYEISGMCQKCQDEFFGVD